MPYRFEKTTLKNAKRLPLGVPFNGKIYTNFKVKGLTTALLLSLHKALGDRPDIELSEVINTILRASLQEVGPYKQPFTDEMFDKLLRTLTSVDREFLAWMVVLANSHDKQTYAIRDVDFSCNCTGTPTRWKSTINGWNLDCVMVDPTIWKLHDEALAYTIPFEEKQVTALVSSGAVEESLRGLDSYEKTFRYLSQTVVAVDEQKWPFRGEGLTQGDPHYQSKLFQALMPDPLPGVDNTVYDYCAKCKKKVVSAVTFIPFLYGAFESRGSEDSTKETVFTML